MPDAQPSLESRSNIPSLYRPPLVIAVHGIRTHAPWFLTLAEVFSEYAIPFRLYRYGFFRAWRMLLGPTRETALENFVSFYEEQVALYERRGVDRHHYAKRPSVIAHSFGSYLVGECLLKYDHITFDKAILCGSILPRDFPWSVVTARGQVNQVYNDYGGRDFWSGIVGMFVPRKMGPSGRVGFRPRSMLVEQHPNPMLRHRDYFKRERIGDCWMNVLRKRPSGLCIRHGKEINDLSEYERILQEKIDEIDEECFGPLEGYRQIAPSIKQLLSWVETEPDIYTFLTNAEGHLIGYLDAVPVTDEMFEKVKVGEKQEKDIEPTHIVPLTDGTSMKMYVTALALHKDVRRKHMGLLTEPLERLANGFLWKLIRYAEDRRIRVTDLVAVAWTDPGEKWCKYFGMHTIPKDNGAEKKAISVSGEDGHPDDNGTENKSKFVTDKNGHPVYHLSLAGANIERPSRQFQLLGKLLKAYQLMENERSG